MRAAALATLVIVAASYRSASAEHRWLFNEPSAEQADQEAGAPVPFAPDWTLRAEPSAWFAGVAGKIRMPGSGTSLEFDQLNLDNTGFVPMVEAHYRRDRWRLTLRGFTLDESASSTAAFDGTFGELSFNAGDTLTSDFSLTSVELEGSYRFEPFAIGRRAEGDVVDLDTWFELVGGVRVYAMDFDVAVESTRQSESRIFGEPLVGVRWNLEIDRTFSIDVIGSLGGFAVDGDTYSVSADVIVGGTWRVTPNAGVQIGYRQLASFFGDGSGEGEFSGSASTAGLYAGFELRF